MRACARGGEPGRAPGPQGERAWATLPGCGAAGGIAARDAWASLRSERDSARIATTYDRLRSFRDASLFGAARAVLLDSAASAVARVSSAMLVVAQLGERADPDYRVFSSTGPHDACTIGSADRPLRDGAPLAADASAQAESTALRVLASASAPPAVRNAARCLYDAVTRDDGVLAGRAPAPGAGEHLNVSAGRIDSARSRAAATIPPRARRPSQPRARPPANSARGVADLLGEGGCATARDSVVVRAADGRRVHEGILRRSPRGDVLELRGGRRLPVANLPPALEHADGMRVWIAEPLGAPPAAGAIDPSRGDVCPE